MKKLVTLLLVMVFLTGGAFYTFAKGDKADEPEEKAMEEKVEAEGPSDEVYVDEWVIPNMIYMTGGWAPYAEIQIWAMDIAIQEINDSGGIRGVPVRVVNYDSGTHQPEIAVPNMAKILDTKPLIMMGPHGSTDAEATGQMAVDEGVYSLEVTASYDTAKKYNPWANVWVTSTEQFAKTPAQKWIELNPDIKSVVMFTQPEASTWLEQVTHQKEGLEAVGVEVLDMIPVTEAVDFGPLAVRAMKHNPDGFVTYVYAEAMVKITFELMKRGVDETRRFLYPHSAGSPEFWELADGKLDGAYIWSLFNPKSTNPKWVKLAKAYEEKYNSAAASWVIPADYDTIYLIKACFEDLKITGDPKRLKEERIAIRDWMNNVRDFEFAANTINIVDGEYQAPVWMFTIENNNMGGEPINCGLTWK